MELEDRQLPPGYREVKVCEWLQRKREGSGKGREERAVEEDGKEGREGEEEGNRGEGRREPTLFI